MGSPGWSIILAAKLGLVTVLLFLTVTHNLIIGPWVGRVVQLPAERHTKFDRMMILWSPWVARLSLILARS